MYLTRLFRQSVFFRTGFILILFACISGTMPVHATPSPFSLISPENGAKVSTKVLLDWSDSTDPDGLKYVIFISKGDGVFEEEDDFHIPEITRSCYVLENRLEDLTDYYWKVRAKNKYEERFETEVRHFRTDNGNIVKAWVGGHVYSKDQVTPVPNISIKIISKIRDKIFSLATDLNGGFCGELNFGEITNDDTEEVVTVDICMGRCKLQSFERTVVFDNLTELPDVALEFDGVGDINCDLCVDLNDAVLLLQILTGQGTPDTVSENACSASESDKKALGLAELIYILQKIAEPSPCSQN